MQVSEKTRQKQSVISGLWQAIRPDKAINAIRLLWSKIPDGWHKNPYAWTGIGCTLVFFSLFAVSWVQWHEYREENRRLRTIADKHKVTTVMLNELYPELAMIRDCEQSFSKKQHILGSLQIFAYLCSTRTPKPLNNAQIGGRFIFIPNDNQIS